MLKFSAQSEQHLPLGLKGLIQGFLHEEVNCHFKQGNSPITETSSSEE
jgi:hypothetical protein